MSVLSRLLGYASRKERAGARLDDRHPWIVPPTRDASLMLRALHSLFPDGGFVYFEGITEAAFASWLQAQAVLPPLKIAYGTIWPRPDYFHIPLDPLLLEEAAKLVDQKGIALPSIHVHVHDGATVLLEWHDAFDSDPMYVARQVPRERVDAFAILMNVGPVSVSETAI